MPHKLTLQTLAENLIRESREPFSVDEYIEAIQNRWRRRIAPATLDHLKQTLTNHSHVIEVSGESFLPYQAVLDRIGHIPLEIQLGKADLQHKWMIPGHHLAPFISPDLEEYLGHYRISRPIRNHGKPCEFSMGGAATTGVTPCFL